MKNESKRIAVFGEVFSPNVGDGVIFDCLKWRLEFLGASVRPCDLSMREGYDNGTVSKLPAEDEVHLARRFARFFVRRSLLLRRAITVLKWFGWRRGRFVRRYEPEIISSDIVLIGGGQILVDRQLGFPLAISAVVSIARRHKKKIVVFSCGADTKQSYIARTIFRRMARSASYITVRDEDSKKFLLSLDANLSVSVHPDVGFLASSVYPPSAPSPEKVIGVNIMPHATLAAFAKEDEEESSLHHLATWTNFVRSIVEGGSKVHILTNGDPLDFSAASAVYKCFESDGRVTLIGPPHNAIDLVEQLQCISVLIAARMHSGIVAYSYGRTVIPIAWDLKVRSTWLEADDRVKPIKGTKGLNSVDHKVIADAEERQRESKIDLIKNVLEKHLDSIVSLQ